jgi:GTP-dependent phosphoenolpyruvate carboxykinase
VGIKVKNMLEVTDSHYVVSNTNNINPIAKHPIRTLAVYFSVFALAALLAALFAILA